MNDDYIINKERFIYGQNFGKKKGNKIEKAGKKL